MTGRAVGILCLVLFLTAGTLRAQTMTEARIFELEPSAMTPLMKEAGRGDAGQVRKLLREGADVFAVDRITGASALHFAVQGGNVEVVKMLVGAGAHINQQVASHGMTPLMVAVWHRNPDVVDYLLSLPGINVNIKATGGGDAFSMVQGTKKSNDPSAGLPEEGRRMQASLERYRKNAVSDPLSHQLIELVTDKSLDDGQRAARAQALIRRGADVNYRQPNIQSGNDSHPAVLIASRDGYAKTVKVLLDNGADITLLGELMKAHPGHKAGYQGRVEVMKLLVAHPDFHEIMNLQGPFNGYTALHDAVWHGSYGCAKLLVDAGADVTLKGWDGCTALDLAEKYGYTDIVELLKERKR